MIYISFNSIEGLCCSTIHHINSFLFYLFFYLCVYCCRMLVASFCFCLVFSIDFMHHHWLVVYMHLVFFFVLNFTKGMHLDLHYNGALMHYCLQFISLICGSFNFSLCCSHFQNFIEVFIYLFIYFVVFLFTFISCRCVFFFFIITLL